ncbi:(R)-1-hydroxy-2-aminoethylphosphonate ammonia-lyase [Methylobacterium oryzihabitans]|uniref:Aspartate aminotransferase family protein n=1 Tax=Methylobacterium oryzihabitans TaxID=2499852 RepID=A0A3S3U3V7_9HYPH|nr:aspartate aminotransferase family protein [Methylobacterium oryzihabitans]RVU14955.1 aspartate aminotransferase family protein [Methylobacterium oryzihabitans]
MTASATRSSGIAESEGDTNLTGRRAAWQARSLDGETRGLLARDARAFLHQSVSTPCLNAIARAEGIWIEDVAGRRYMDFHGNNVHHVGYGHPRVKRAIAEQMDALPFAPRRYACAGAVALAERLGALAPGDLGKVLFTTGGSDAIEVAVKVARAATGRHKTLSFWDAFHGAGTGASAMSGEMLFRSGPAGPLVAGALHVAPFGGYRCPYGTDGAEASGRACARMIDYVLSRDGDVAALVAEPTRAVPYVPPPGFWAEVRRICDRHGVLLIFDEIPTGLGKTGRMFSCEHDGVVPDILVLGKGLGGGILPIAAVVADRRLDVGGDWAFGHYTHEKNPVTARAALETLAIIEDEDLVGNAARVGALALDRLEAMKARHPAIGDVRGRGCLIGIELVGDRATREPDADLAEAVLYRALDAGLSFKTTMGNVLTLTPPLVVSEAQMLAALDIVEAAIAGAAKDRG